MTEPAAATTQSSGARTYAIPTAAGDIHLPSVTTILKVMDRPPLIQWAANTAAAYALDNQEWVDNLLSVNKRKEAYDGIRYAHRERRDTAATRGTDIHDVLERFILGEEIPPEDQSPYFRSALSFISDWDAKFEASEATVYNLTEGYAGTMDALVRVEGGELLVADWKSRQGKRVSQTGIWETELLQVAAYANAEFVLLPSGVSVALPAVAGGLVVALCLDGFRVGVADLVADFGGFRMAKGLFDWREGLKGRNKE